MQPNRLTHIPTVLSRHLGNNWSFLPVGLNRGYVDKTLNWGVKKT